MGAYYYGIYDENDVLIDNDWLGPYNTFAEAKSTLEDDAIYTENLNYHATIWHIRYPRNIATAYYFYDNLLMGKYYYGVKATSNWNSADIRNLRVRMILRKKRVMHY